MNRSLLLFLSLLSVFFLEYCGSKPHSHSKKVFRYNESAGINSLDPAFARVLEDMRAVNQIYDGLLILDDSLNVKPHLAKSYSVSEDGLEYTFELRTGIMFQEDEAFNSIEERIITADDFVYSFNRILDPKVASPGMWIFQNIDNSNGEGFKAINDSTLLIRLMQPFPSFTGILTMQYCNVVPKKAVEYYGSEFRNHPVGCGPFKMAFWLEGVSLILHKNPMYWMNSITVDEIPKLDAVRIDFVEDKSSMFFDFLKGKYDFISGIDQSYKDELLDQEGNLTEAYEDIVNFQKTPFIKVDYIGLLVDQNFISENSFLNKKKFRQALNYATDRKKLVKYLRNNSVYPAENGFLPSGFGAHGLHSHEGYSFDLEKAKDLIKESGADVNEVITISTTSAYVDICEYLQFQWGQLGLNVKVEVLQSSNHRELVANSKVPVFRKSWLADYADEENFLGLFYSKNFSPNGPNYTHFKNDEFDALFEQAASTADYEHRKRIYAELDSIILEEAPVVPLFYDQVSHFINPRISNFSTNSVNMLDFTFVDKAN